MQPSDYVMARHEALGSQILSPELSHSELQHIPTEWPAHKLEAIPTHWPKFELLPAQGSEQDRLHPPAM